MVSPSLTPVSTRTGAGARAVAVGVARKLTCAGHFSTDSVPVAGRKLASGFSAQMRASIAWPRILRSACVAGSGSPEATRSCHSTRSCPLMASVTGCSTCRRVFISMK